jgi:rod shape determining protein RodA
MQAAHMINLRYWKNSAYIFYAVVLFSLIVVEILGIVKLGAQRWINLYFFAFQPSEPMKIALILALARYYSVLSPLETADVKRHVFPFLLTVTPAILICKQPDLGTAGLLVCVGIGMMFLAGFPWKIFVAIAGSCATLCPFGWFFLHDYQRNRILTFLNPDNDPLGTGYHILQSKIAIGSGGAFGRGLLEGTQSSLNFLPEKNTDFIFAMAAEEWGFFGSLFIIALFLALCGYFFWTASKARSDFAKFVCYGIGMLTFLHVFVNIAMAIGLFPIVGIPLPFLSYGGSSMITFAIGCGLAMSALGRRK